MGTLDGKVTIVTGAASGMGKAIAERFAKEGAKTVAVDVNLEGVQETVSNIKSNGGDAIALLVDVSKEEHIQMMVDKAVENYGTLDILVNNAGIMDNFEPAGDVTDALWERIFAVNTTSVLRATRKAIPIFLEKEYGVIINIASTGGLHGSMAGAAYTASKHAVVGLTKNIGFQYAKKGIRCNAIAPGSVATNIGVNLKNPNKFGMERCSMGFGLSPRIGEPDEIAGTALFLASDAASFVNGHVLVVDGGWSAY